jgi:hypothetical protein
MILVFWGYWFTPAGCDSNGDSWVEPFTDDCHDQFDRFVDGGTGVWRGRPLTEPFWGWADHTDRGNEVAIIGLTDFKDASWGHLVKV